MKIRSEDSVEAKLQRANYDLMAEDYDSTYGNTGVPTKPIVEFLAELSAEKPGRFFEIGIGTGRIAIPLSKRVGEVHGVDVSPKMLEILETKDGADAVTKWLDEYPRFPWDGRKYDVCYFPSNVIYHATSEPYLQSWFQKTHEILKDNGLMLVEVYVSDLPEEPELKLEAIVSGVVYLKATCKAPNSDIYEQSLILVSPDGIKSAPTKFRAHSLEEVDHIAGRSGFSLLTRKQGWAGTKKWTGSGWCVSVFEKTRI